MLCSPLGFISKSQCETKCLYSFNSLQAQVGVICCWSRSSHKTLRWPSEAKKYINLNLLSCYSQLFCINCIAVCVKSWAPSLPSFLPPSLSLLSLPDHWSLSSSPPNLLSSSFLSCLPPPPSTHYRSFTSSRNLFCPLLSSSIHFSTILPTSFYYIKSLWSSSTTPNSGAVTLGLLKSQHIILLNFMNSKDIPYFTVHPC